MLLRHVHPDAWFEAAFVPYDPGYTAALAVPAPAILARARKDLASIHLRPRHQPERRNGLNRALA